MHRPPAVETRLLVGHGGKESLILGAGAMQTESGHVGHDCARRLAGKPVAHENMPEAGVMQAGQWRAGQDVVSLAALLALVERVERAPTTRANGASHDELAAGAVRATLWWAVRDRFQPAQKRERIPMQMGRQVTQREIAGWQG